MARFKEQLAFDHLKKSSQGVLLLHRVENQCNESMPDVIGENRRGKAFWLEMKALHEWPVRATTLPLKRAFEKGQLSWGAQWVAWGGSSFVLLRVHAEYLLLPPVVNLADFDRQDLYLMSVKTGTVHDIIKYLEAL